MSVLLETSVGDIVIDLLVDYAPKSCENFLKLCKLKYYNFSPIYGVQKDFSFQTGDPMGPESKDSDGGSSIWGLTEGPSRKTFSPEFHPKLKHEERGTVSMATAPSAKDPDERVAASQFIITTGNNLDFLDGKAAIFGKVVEGFDSLEHINKAFCDEKGRPLRDIRIRHTAILDDPYDDPPGLVEPAESPVPTAAQLATVRLADDEDLEENRDEEAEDKRRREREARAQALTLEMVGDLPFAEVKPPENILFVCKLNPVTQDEDLELIFSRFGKILSCEVIRDKRTGDSLQYAFIEFENQKDCEQAYFKMQGVLIDDHRIHVDFSQSVSKLSETWRTATNSKRAKRAGGFGGVSGLEKRRQYKAMDGTMGRSDGYSMVFDSDEVRRRHERVGDRKPEIRRKSRSRSRSRSPVKRTRDYSDRRRDRRYDDRRREGGNRNQCTAGSMTDSIDYPHMTAKGATPREPTAQELDTLKEKYRSAGQDHVFAFYESLDAAEKAGLYEQLYNIDPAYINQIAEKALKPAAAKEQSEVTLEPLPESATASILDSKQEDLERWYASGLDLVAKNKVAVVLMAGGQGTRLGSAAPKGCFDIGLYSRKSLFQIQAERILRVQQLASKGRREEGKVVVPWYVMTSGPTRGPTEKFFEEHDYFSLEKDNVFIFEQGVLPCISNEGKILMESKAKVAVAPDGNGGIYQALFTSSALSDMSARGIEHIHAYCVDNCLVKVADPVFIGFSASKGVDIATKVVRKRSANESVGLILLKNGKPDVVEYSEIDKNTAEAMDPKQQGVLKFRAANIVNHYYSFQFLDSVMTLANQLPHHVARKKIPYIDTKTGEAIKPEKPNGIKLEQFVFDVFPHLELGKFACMEVRREDEFSPLKNARGTGEDDPDTSKRDILDQGKRWALAAGAIVSEDGVEISPLISYGGEGLEFLNGQRISAPAVVEKKS